MEVLHLLMWCYSLMYQCFLSQLISLKIFLVSKSLFTFFYYSDYLHTSVCSIICPEFEITIFHQREKKILFEDIGQSQKTFPKAIYCPKRKGGTRNPWDVLLFPGEPKTSWHFKTYDFSLNGVMDWKHYGYGLGKRNLPIRSKIVSCKGTEKRNFNQYRMRKSYHKQTCHLN